MNMQVPAKPRVSKPARVPFDVQRVRAGFSHPQADGARQAAHLSRQCRVDAEAAGGDRRHPRLLRRRQCQRPSRRAHAQRTGHAQLRGVAQQSPPLPGSKRRPRDHFRARHHRGHQSRGQQLWPKVPRAKATRSLSPTWSTIRTSFPGSSSASSAALISRSPPSTIAAN